MDHAGAKRIGAPVMTTLTPPETTALALAGTVREEVPAGLRAWLGLASGLLLGGLDLLIARASGLELHLGGRDVSLVTFGIFALSYGAFGFVLGRLLEARRVLERHAATIAAQLGEIQVSQARALHYEKLASIGRLAAGVAHEVRNSLGVVRSSAAFLLEDLETAEGADVDPDRRRAGRFIREEIDRLDGFVRSLLDYSRPLTPSLGEVELFELLTRVVVAAAVEGPRVEVDAAVAGRRCQADRDLITQALLGLTLNACQAVTAGGRVALRSPRAEPADELWIEVADDGPGVAPADAGRIFEPFFTTKAQGTGLGLPMAERIARAHDGRDELVPGRGLGPAGAGSCFRLALPLRPSRRAAQPSSSASSTTTLAAAAAPDERTQ